MNRWSLLATAFALLVTTLGFASSAMAQPYGGYEMMGGYYGRGMMYGPGYGMMGGDYGYGPGYHYYRGHRPGYYNYYRRGPSYWRYGHGYGPGMMGWYDR